MRTTRTTGSPSWFVRVPRSAFPRRQAPDWPALDPSVMRAAQAPAPVPLHRLVPAPRFVTPRPVATPPTVAPSVEDATAPKSSALGQSLLGR